MKAVVLAAGRGKRLAPLTDDKPKCLVSINGRTLLERAISSLRAGGACPIGIVGGYLSERVVPFADHFFLNRSWNESGIFSSLSWAQQWLDSEACLVAYSDIFFGPQTVRALSCSDAAIAIAFDPHAVDLWRLRSSDPLADLETFAISSSGYVTDIGRRPQTLEEIQGQYMGLMKIEPKGWRALLEARAGLPHDQQSGADMTSLLSRVAASGLPIAAVPTSEPWGEVDTARDLIVYERLYPAI